MLGIILIIFIMFTGSFILSTLLQNNSIVAAISLDNLWEINQSNGHIQPINLLSENRTVTVFDLEIISAGSLKIGIVGNTTFATISATNATSIQKNATRFGATIDGDWIPQNNYNGTSFLAMINNNLLPNSNAFVSASDDELNGMTLNKWNRNHEQPYLNGLVGLNGNMEIRTTTNNVNSELGGNTSNNLKLGFYDNLTLGDEVSVSQYNGRRNIIQMNISEISLNRDTNLNNVLYFNQSFNGNGSSPDAKFEKIALFARDDDNLYITRSTGQIKRVSVVGMGSSVFSEEIKINNHTYFFGNVYLNNSVYNGGGVGYACIDGIGRLFKSSTPCHLTSSTFTRGNISDPTMGDEP